MKTQTCCSSTGFTIHSKPIKFHWIAQWFVNAKSGSALPRNAYRTFRFLLVLETQIDASQDLH